MISKNVFNDFDYVCYLNNDYECSETVLSMWIYGKKDSVWGNIMNELIDLLMPDNTLDIFDATLEEIIGIEDVLIGAKKSHAVHYYKERYNAKGTIKRTKRDVTMRVTTYDKFGTQIKEVRKFRLPDEYIEK